MNRFPTGEEKELELWCRKCKAFTDEKHGCKDCKKCGTDTKCKHCKGDIAIRNPKGFCDHLYYPENCEVCRRDTKMKPDWEIDRIHSEIYDVLKTVDPDVRNHISKLIGKLTMKKEEQHNKYLDEKYLETTKKHLKECVLYDKQIEQLKQQHREALEGKFMISAFDAHYLAGVILSELGHPVFEKSHAVARNMQKNREALCEMFLALIEQHKMQFSQKEIDFVTNLLEQKGK